MPGSPRRSPGAFRLEAARAETAPHRERADERERPESRPRP